MHTLSQQQLDRIDAECIAQTYQDVFSTLIPGEGSASALRDFLSADEVRDLKDTLTTLINYL